MTQGILLFLLENTLTIAILTGGVLLIKKLFHRHLSAFMHYVLWGIVVLKLLIPVGIASEASPWNLFNAAAPAENTVAEADADAAASSGQDTAWNGYRQFPAVEKGSRMAEAENAAANRATAVIPLQPQAVPALPIKVNWPLTLLIIWAAGVCATGAWLWLGKKRISRQIGRIKSANAPAWMSNMLDGCRAVLRIERPIDIVLQEALPVPAIMGVVRPRLVLPAHLAEEGDKKQLRHILFHELMHYKRKDLLVIGLLNALSAIYWFNPAVWLLVRFVRKDMETACDANVLSALGEHRRQDYIFTLVKFTGRSNHCRVQAALSLNDGKTEMKKRIAGMFLASRTKTSVKVPVMLLVLLMAFMCFTTACQPTPEKPIVVDKRDMEKKITEAPSASQTAAASDKLTKNFSQGKMNVTVSAKVAVPGVEKFPVVKTEPAGFTQEQADRIVKVLMQGKPIYDPPTQQTKAELQKQIVYYKAMAEKMKASESERMKAGVNSDAGVDGKLGNLVSDLESKVAAAPDKVDLKPADGKFKEISQTGGEEKVGYEGREMQAVAELGQEYRAEIYINCSTSKKMSSVWFTHQDLFSHYNTWNSLPDGTAAGMKMSREAALALAEKTVTDLGSDLKLACVRIAPAAENTSTADARKQAYAFYFTREVNGVPTTYDQNDGSMLDMPQDEKELKYYEPYPAEMLYMVIDDTGIVELNWTSPAKLTGTVTDNAAILNADEALERFCQQFLIQNAPKPKAETDSRDVQNGAVTDEDIKQMDVTVDRITLGMMRVPAKDKPGEYMLVPVWDFYGSEKITYSRPIADLAKGKGQTKTEETVDHSIMSLLTVNAIDGSVYNRGKSSGLG
jgi:beta-lactamase regulating signal transducer with metallopeptidase domain